VRARATIRATLIMLIERALHDVRYAARSLRRSPGFAITAILVLALGIGANTAVFSVARRVLLRPLPYSEPDRLVQFVSRTQTGLAPLASVPKYNEWRQGIGPKVYSRIAAYYASGPGMTLTSGGRQLHLSAMYVSSDYFGVFDAPIALGRTFTSSEDTPQGPRLAVISHAFWLREFGGARNPVGHSISLGNEPHEVVGVMGSAFESMPAVDVWLPLQAPRVSFNHTNYLTVVGRLRPGVTLARADAQSRHLSAPFRQKFPWSMGHLEEFGVEPLDRMVAGDTQSALRMLAGAVGFVLLIACANVANLFAARATRREGDIATRAALGASRARLIRLLFTECVLVSLAGGVLGLGAGYSGVRALLAASPGGMPSVPSVTPDSQVLTFTLGLSILTAIVFGLLPVLTASRVDLSSTMKDSATQGATGIKQHRRQSVLVVIELMLAIVLLVGAGLLLRTFAGLRSVDRGFDAANILTVEMPLNDARFQQAEPVDALVRDVERRIETVAGAGAVATTYSLPLEPTVSIPFTLVNRALPGAAYHGVGDWRTVSPRYFEVFRIRLLTGRLFTDRDDAAGQRVVIINRAMARRLWQSADPVGERLIIGKSADREFDELPRSIVGVVADVRDRGLSNDSEPMMYVPLAQTSDRMIARNNRFLSMTWVVRTIGEPMTFRSEIARELSAASGGLPIARVRSMAAIVRATTAQLEFTTILLAIFAGAALLLAAVGLYGLMSYSVEQRTQEIGIRIALGASPAGVRNMVLAQGGRLTAAGVCLGVGAAIGLSRLMSSVVFGIATWDPAVFGAVAALLAVVSVTAVYVPALAATRVEPTEALRR
jgi:putative ABC transport system permease protein